MCEKRVKGKYSVDTIDVFLINGSFVLHTVEYAFYRFTFKTISQYFVRYVFVSSKTSTRANNKKPVFTSCLTYYSGLSTTEVSFINCG
jgi:hypothetical protein